MQIAAGRIGTERSPDIDPDYHWNSLVPHLLAVATRAAFRTIPRKQEYRTRKYRETAPHSIEFRHYTAYPEIPEATWAQPLSREELS